MNQHKPGVKLDDGKNRVGLTLAYFPRALLEVSEVSTFGAVKYTDFGWLQVDNALKRYTDAMFRHFLLEFTGENYDKESNLLHAAHAAWNALAVLELKLRQVEQINEDMELFIKPSESL